MDNTKIYFDYNPWWEGRSIPKRYCFGTKRKLFVPLYQNLKKGKMISVVGPRRVGKTVLLYQLIEVLLQQKVNSQNIFYLSCDDPSLIVEKHLLEDAVEFYEKNIIQKPLKNSKAAVFFFLDEIQKIERWAEYLKKYIDLGYQINFIISGSSSITMIKNSRESLTGRCKEYILPPVSFAEYLLWEENISSLGKISLSFTYLEKTYKEIFLQQSKFLTAFEKFIRLGGFPETYSLTQQERIDYIKKEVVERVLFRDIPEVTKIKNPQLTAKLLTLASYDTANVISYQALSQKLGARFETISEHLFYLEFSFLVSILRKYSRGGVSVAKSQPKLHVADSSVILALANKYDTILAEKDFLGRVIESMVVTHLRFSDDHMNLFFWRDERSEVDVIVDLPVSPLPIEVKYTNKFERGDFLGLSHFQQKYHPKLSLVLTENYFGKENWKIFLPVWFFLAGEPRF